MYPLAGSVLELHAARTQHTMLSAGGKHRSCGDEERVHGGGLQLVYSRASQHAFHQRAESDVLIALRSHTNAPRPWPESVYPICGPRWPRLLEMGNVKGQQCS